MKLLKKIVFILLFFITLLSVTGNANSYFQQNMFVTENTETRNERNSTSELSSENDDEEVSLNDHQIYTIRLFAGQRVILRNIHFFTWCSFAFWQPPKFS